MHRHRDQPALQALLTPYTATFHSQVTAKSLLAARHSANTSRENSRDRLQRLVWPVPPAHQTPVHAQFVWKGSLLDLHSPAQAQPKHIIRCFMLSVFRLRKRSALVAVPPIKTTSMLRVSHSSTQRTERFGKRKHAKSSLNSRGRACLRLSIEVHRLGLMMMCPSGRCSRLLASTCTRPGGRLLDDGAHIQSTGSCTQLPPLFDLA